MQGTHKGGCALRAVFAAAIAAAVVFGSVGQARAAEYSIAPVPAWVKPVELPAHPVVREEQVANGAFHLLVDAQVRAVDGNRETYRRFATKALNAAGVEAIANVAIAFDPSYQVLTLHSLDVIRDGKAVSRLKAAQIRVLQRESELEYRIYDGRKSANVFLEDVRVGDTIDYSYSVRGANPVFGGRAFGQFGLQFDEPAGRVHARLVYAGDRAVVVKARNTDHAESVSDMAGAREYEWSAQDVAPLLVERDAPSWYDPYATLEWSAFGSWGEVANWALPLYAPPARPDHDLQAEIDRIAAAHDTPAARTIAALQFVQQEVRYLGVEVGPGSHAPNPPNLVLKRRFGDCKDKALLLVTMLRALGVEASPALVSTRATRGIAGHLPSPAAFDHVIVSTRVGGEPYWLDPTRSKQVGDLDHIYQPDFGRALVIDAATTDLVPMKNPAAARSATQVSMVYDARGGLAKVVPLAIVTLSAGGQAESTRDRLRTQSADDAQKNYLNFYARSFPGIKVAKPFEVADDAAANTVAVSEHYEVQNLSTPMNKAHAFNTVFEFPDTENLLADPPSTVRHAPLFQMMPMDVTNSTDILLPMPTSVKAHSSRVEDPAFTFERSVSLKDDRHIVITDHFVTLADEIAPDDVARYAANLRKAREGLGYSLNWSDAQSVGEAAASGSLNWAMGTCAALALLLSLLGAWRLYRWDPAPREPVPRNAPVGLGGWLLLPALSFPIRTALALYPLYVGRVFMDSGVWQAFTSPDGSHYEPTFALTAVFETSTNIMFAVFMVLLAVLFLKRRTSLPWLLPASLWLQWLVAAIDAYLSNSMPGLGSSAAAVSGEIGRGLIAAIIWTRYFAVSARVRATFINRYRAPMPSESSRDDDTRDGHERVREQEG